MLIVWPWQEPGDAQVGWSDPEQGRQWAIVVWADGTQSMTFQPGSPAIEDGTLAKLPLAPESHPAPV